MIKPYFFNLLDQKDFNKLNLYLEDTSVFKVDEIDNQLEELFFIRNPQKSPNTVSVREIHAFIKTFYQPSKNHFGTWVFFPWNRYLVHYLPEKMHTEIRTARNRNLITQKEQDEYYSASVGIAGLSVGNSAMATLLYTGGAKNLRLADHDRLSASNLNRIRTSFIHIGEKKVEVAAKELYEVNPYINLSLYPEGLNLTNIEEFLLKPRKLDVLIEEMDNLYLKVQIRLLAKKYGIPIVMVTDNGDNIMLDIERYDLNPKRPIFNSNIAEKELINISPNISKPEAASIISRLVGINNIADRMKISLLELGKTLYSWPQLGNAAILGGCVISYCVRKIIIKESLKEGKFFISLDELLIPDHYTDSVSVKRKEIDALLKKEFKVD